MVRRELSSEVRGKWELARENRDKFQIPLTCENSMGGGGKPNGIREAFRLPSNLLRAKYPVASIAEAREDIPVAVQLPVQNRGEDPDIGMRL